MIGAQSDSGPTIVDVDGSGRSVEVLALADLLAPSLGRRVMIPRAPSGTCRALFAEAGCERLALEVARVDLRADS